MKIISSSAIPVLTGAILILALMRGKNAYDLFMSGAEYGLKTSINIAVPLVGLLAAVSMLRASGAMELIGFALGGLCKKTGFPSGALPLALLRPISGSGALAVLSDILTEYGPDSFTGRVASVISGSTETTFYTLAVYFGAVKVKKTRYTLPAALTADVTGFLVSAFVVSRFFGLS